MASQNNLEQQLSAEQSQRRQLQAECERLKEKLNAVEKERNHYLEAAHLLALEHLTEEELEKFSFENYVVPVEKLIEELERMHRDR